MTDSNNDDSNNAELSENELAANAALVLGDVKTGFIQAGVAQPGTVAVDVNIITVTQTAVGFHFNTLQGNSPSANANTAFLWQTDGPQIPWSTSPYGQVSLPVPTTSGAYAVQANITQSGYVVGYAVGSSVGNIVATSWVPNPSNPPQPTNFVPSLALFGAPTSEMVNLLYSLPPGSRPQANNHWVGIYTGAYPTFGNFPDAAYQAIPSNVANTSVSVFPQGLTAGATYTAAYFAGGYNSTTPTSSKLGTMCALVTFVVPTS